MGQGKYSLHIENDSITLNTNSMIIKNMIIQMDKRIIKSSYSRLSQLIKLILQIALIF